jgi:hypothetical protein
MAVRIIGIPDTNNIITIACGGDIVEIEVARPDTGDAQGLAPSPTNPPSPVIMGNPEGGARRPTDPFRNPYALNVAPDVMNDGRIDFTSLTKQLDAASNSVELSAANGVVINAIHPLNLHDIVKLSTELEDRSPGARIALQFGESDE